MSDFGRILMLVGAAIAVLGAAIWLAGRSGFRGLPGDVALEGQGIRLYFPIVTCIVISVALTLGLWLWRWLGGR